MSDWNTAVIEEFRANEGRVQAFGGANLVLMHTIGARTGTERVVPVAFMRDGDDLVVAGSKAGAPTNPDWYHNLKAHPHVTVEQGPDTFEVEAVEATGDDRDQLWERLKQQMPGFGDYEKKTDRVIPMIRLKRV